MKTVKTIISLAIAATSALGFTACDEVDEADRYKELTKIESKRNVLIEDFTGQMCTNCPDGHRLISTLQEQYGENIIAVGIHAGSFGIAENSMPGVIGLMQPEGNEYAKKFGVESYPSGIINRNTSALSFTEWSASVRTEIERESNLNIKLSAKVENGMIVISSELQPLKDIKGKLQVWITESNIVTLQVDNGKYLMDYVHNHVYRASVNGAWGEDVSLKANIFDDKKHEIAVKDGWNVENLSVVAFVYNDNDGVYQAAECKVE